MKEIQMIPTCREPQNQFIKNPSILSILELAKPALPASLIDAQGYEHVAAIARQLPGQLTTFWGFECRLGEPEARADILFETKKQSQGLRMLSGQLPSSLDALCREIPTWQTLREFATHWIDPDHPFSQHINNIWLEFDTAAAASPVQAAAVIQQPNIFFGPEAKFLSKNEFYHFIKNALDIFKPDTGDNHSLRSFVAALPEGAKLFQIGMMLSRKNSGLRLCVNKLNPEEIPSWLGRLNWPGETEAIAHLLRLLLPIIPTWAINLDLTRDGLMEKIGLECYMDWLVDEPGQWSPLLDLISNRNLCLGAKRHGMMEFPGITRTPDHISQAGDCLLYLDLFRKIHHVKLTICAGQLVEAKTYLALSRPALHLDLTAADKRDAWLLE